MILKRTNIEEKLKKEVDKNGAQDAVLAAVYQLLKKDDVREEEIALRLAKPSKSLINPFNLDLLESHKVFHISHIKKICIDYRLRFLDSSYFKSDIPYEAISAIKALEQLHQIELRGFKILAPSKLFRLDHKDDPLLFASIGNGYYYLVHRWGNDLHPLRKIYAWPFRNIGTLSLLILGLAMFLTFIVPEGLFSRNTSAAEFWIVYFFVFKSLAAIVIFYGFALGKNFNHAIWNNRFDKA